MKQDKLSFNAQVGIGTDLFYKFQFLFILFVLSFTGFLSAQELQSEATNFEAKISVVGDAFIYSKDQSFNKQVSKNTVLQKNTDVKFTQGNELVIRGRNAKKQNLESNTKKKKTDNVVLASKKVKKYKTVDLPKKDILFRIKALDESSKFFSATTLGNVSFIAPTNDYHITGCFLKVEEYFENKSIEFLLNIDYFYNNDNYISQLYSSDLSVRPPPSTI